MSLTAQMPCSLLTYDTLLRYEARYYAMLLIWSACATFARVLIARCHRSSQDAVLPLIRRLLIIFAAALLPRFAARLFRFLMSRVFEAMMLFAADAIFSLKAAALPCAAAACR